MQNLLGTQERKAVSSDICITPRIIFRVISFNGSLVMAIKQRNKKTKLHVHHFVILRYRKVLV